MFNRAGTSIPLSRILRQQERLLDLLARRLVPHRNVRGDLTIHQPLKQPDRAINSVASEPLGPKIEAAADALHHRLSDGNFRYAVGPRAFGVEDDPELVVD